jgi:arsenate reductase
MLGHLGGELKKLFNTSGQVYREMKLGEKLPTMSEAQALKLLAANGKLIKRPFLLAARGGAVGFKEAEWKKLL